MLQTKALRLLTFILSITIVNVACSNDKKPGHLGLDTYDTDDLRVWLPKLLNKSLIEIDSLLDLSVKGFYVVDEPPSIMRGVFYQWSEQTTIQFMTERLPSITLAGGLTRQELSNFEETDRENLWEQRVIGIKWDENDSIFYIGKGFIWNHYLYIDDSKHVLELKSISKVDSSRF